MKIKIILLFFFICFQTILVSQPNLPFSVQSKKNVLSVFNGSQTIATSYTYSACGLNYVQASNPLYGRAGNNFTLSVAQPASFNVTGLPLCAVIEKAFLYVGTSGTGTGFSASITDPGGGNSLFPMTVIGSGPDKNWGYAGSYTYRADVTPIISGNGNYIISGIPTGTNPATDDANGATLFIIYSDRTQTYTGNIVIADGSLINTTAGTATATINGFSVCSNPLQSNSFMLVDDLQQYGASNMQFNSATPNFTQQPAGTSPWQFFNVAGSPATLGQNSAAYGITNAADTVGILMAGLYYQTDCVVCSTSLSLVAASTPSCLASGTVAITGGLAPYTYTWTSSAQTTSVVTDLAAGVQTVIASDQSGCLTGSATVLVTTPAPSITVNSGTVCIGYSTTLTAGPAASYTWSPAASVSNSNAATVTVTPLANTIYTLGYTNALGCTGSQTLLLTPTYTQAISINNSTACAGQNLSLSANSFTGAGYTYLWTGPAFTSTQQNPVRASATGTMGGIYNLSVTSVPGCTSMASCGATVFALPSPTITTNSPICANNSLLLNGSGGTTYTWQSSSGFASVAQNTVIANATPAASGAYTLTASFANGCRQTVTQPITVWPLPPANAAIISTNVCVGRTINFQSSGGVSYLWSGPNAFTSNLQNPSILNVQLAANGIYTVLVTDGNTCQSTATVALAALSNPSVSAVSPTVCYGAPATLTANGLGYYTWRGPNGYYDAPLQPYTTVPSANNLALGVYTVELISALNSCSAQATTTLTALSLPLINATGTFVCLNEPATLTVTGGVGYTWTGPGGYTATGANPVVPTVTTTAIDIYTVVGIAPNTCTSTATASVSTIPLPTVVASGSVVCYDKPFTLTATGAVTYTWSGPQSYTALGASAYVPVTNSLTSGNYSVVGTGANTCTFQSVANLTTTPLPVIIATPTTVCLNEPAVLQASGGMPDSSGYRWSGPGGYNSNFINAAIVSATSAAVTVYTVMGTAPNTCTNITTAALATWPLPNVSATGSLVCYKDPFTLVANGAYTYTWTGPPTNTSVAVKNLFIPVVDSARIGTYSVVGTGPNSCTQVATATLAIMPLPNIIATGTTVCISQQPAYLLATGGIPNGYRWYGPNGYGFLGQNAFVPSATSALPQSYTVVGTAPNTCTNSDVAILSTWPLPRPVFNAPPRVCYGSSLTLQGFGAETYTWSGPYNQVYPQQNASFTMYNVAQAGTYTLSVIDSNSCSSYTTCYIGIDPSPQGRLVSDNANKQCVPFCSKFWLTNKEAAPIVNTRWTINGLPFLTDSFNYCAVEPGSEAVTGYFTDLNGCSNTATFAIEASPSPKADFSFSPLNPVEGMDNVTFTSMSKGEDLNRWSWFFINNEGLHSLGENASFIFETSGYYEVAMVVENGWGCQDTVVKTIKIASDFKLFVPNVFTPNDDGINDVFQPKGRGIKKYDLGIYNRMGLRVFHTSDFETGWDGKINGEMSVNDTYVWKIDVTDPDGKKLHYNGHITLAK